MKKLDDDKLPHRARVLKSIVKDVYLKFHELAIERALLVIHARAVKGKAATCDNAKVCHYVLYSLSPSYGLC